jgi:hypothetical protein
MLRALFGLAANLTVNEQINRRKSPYTYLQFPDGSYRNPFDRGPYANLVQFYLGQLPNWTAEADAEYQVRAPVSYLQIYDLVFVLGARPSGVTLCMHFAQRRAKIRYKCPALEGPLCDKRREP